MAATAQVIKRVKQIRDVLDYTHINRQALKEIIHHSVRQYEIEKGLKVLV